MKYVFAGFTVWVVLAIAGISSASGVATTSNVVVNGDFNLTNPGSGIVFPGGGKQTEAVTPDTYQKRIAAACNTGYAVTAVDASGNVTCTPINPGWVISESNDLVSTVKGNVGVGTIKPTSPLTVGGTIETISGGFKFPDGTVQTTAAVTPPPGDCHGGRYEDNGDGTVSDCRTGLIWLKDANCTETAGGIDKSEGFLTWNNAKTWSAALAGGICGLLDGSSIGDWRLPTRTEWMAMVAYAKTRYYGPALTNSAGTAQWTQGDPFLNVQSWAYWTGSQYSNYISTAWYVNMYGGALVGDGISSNYNVWPVRAGQ